MNNAETVIDYYLLIISHVSHTFTSCTHFISYSLINLVHEIVVNLVWPSKIMFSMVFDAKYVYGLAKIVFLIIKNLVLKFQVEKSCFSKTFKLILMHSINEIFWFEYFLHKLLQFFKKSNFPEFRSIEYVFQLIENPLIFNHDFLPDSIVIRSMLDQSKLKNFQFLNI